ncbi:13284_t:CDS:2 [Ambispora leptoticha]|uniref:13284_t:CDS:1 n=1 Tax=Ambispora leptoticha TaxID=144679 RepID=A0A9N9AE38_9GLOM|nr:13284_t:CDS:2 [Ambispora leptoticha]
MVQSIINGITGIFNQQLFQQQWHRQQLHGAKSLSVLPRLSRCIDGIDKILKPTLIGKLTQKQQLPQQRWQQLPAGRINVVQIL